MEGMSDYHTQCMDSMMGSFMGEMEKKLAAEVRLYNSVLQCMGYRAWVVTSQCDVARHTGEAGRDY